MVRTRHHKADSSQTNPGSDRTQADATRLSLARLREKQGISLDQIVNSTKISKRFLLAIEAEAFEELPGGIFSTSYIRQYAGVVGYDEGTLLDLYRLKMGIQDEASPAQSAGTEQGKRTPVKWQRSPVAL